MIRRRICQVVEPINRARRVAQLGFVVLAAVGCADEEEAQTKTESSALTTRPSGDFTDINVAAARNGGVASSSGASVAAQVAYINDGQRGSPYDAVTGLYAYWGSNTAATTYTCNYGNWWARVDFSAPRKISEITLFSLQDNFWVGSDPTETTTTSSYGNVDFHLQYCPTGTTCTASTGWVEPTGGYITGNNKAWNAVSFDPVEATAVRASFDCAQSTYAYAVELEAWQRVTPTVGGPYGLEQTYACTNQSGSYCYDPTYGAPVASTAAAVQPYLDNAAKNWGCDWSFTSQAPYQQPTGAWVKWYGTQSNNLYGCGVAWWNPTKQAAYFLPNSDRSGNVALASRGAKVTVSSTYSSATPASAITDGNRRGNPWGAGGGWSSMYQVGHPTTSNPEWIQIDFDGSKTLNEIVVTTLQDNYSNPVEPYINQTFSTEGIRDFGVWYWNGSSWSVLQNITANNQVYRRITFSPITTQKIRINITAALDGAARVTEVEAYETNKVSYKVYEKYQNTNWDSGVLGMPISNPIKYGWANATYQLFENGVINYYRGNASAVAIGGTTFEDKALASRYLDFFNVTPDNGPPLYATFDVANATDSGGATVGRYVQWYSNGNGAYEMIFARTGGRAFFIDSLVRSAWRTYGAANGGVAYGAEPDLGTPWRAPLGFPITENVVYQQGIDAASYHQEFEKGAIVREPINCSGAYTTTVKTLTNRPILDGYYGMLSCPSGATNNTFFTGNSTALAFNTGVKAGKFQLATADGGKGWFTGVNLTVANQDVVNVAAAANGATVTTSSNYSNAFTGRGAINSDRSGAGWGANGVWHDGTLNTWGDWLQVTFSGSKSINRIDVYSPQDNYSDPVQPTSSMTTTTYALTAFEVQYWTGSAWTDVPGGNVTGNTNVWRAFTFSPITTTSIRVLVSSAAGGYSRLAEVEAWSPVDANVGVKGSILNAWLGGASSTTTIVQAMAGASGTSGLGMPLGNASCGDDAICMQQFDNGRASLDLSNGVVQVMSDGFGPCPNCPKVPYSFGAVSGGYAHDDFSHNATVWMHQDRRYGHKVVLRWNNMPGQSGTTLKIQRISKALGATSWSAPTQIHTSTLGTELKSVFTDNDAVGNARNCYNLWVENSYGGYWSNQACAWTLDDRDFTIFDAGGNITGGEVAQRSVPNPMGYLEVGLDIASNSDAGSNDPVWVSVGNSGPTYIRLPGYYGIYSNSHDFYPLTFTITDVAEVNDIKVAVTGSDNLRISGVTLKIDGVVAFQKVFTTPLELYFANSGIGGYPLATADEIRGTSNLLWTNVYKNNFRGQRYSKTMPRNTGVSGKGVAGYTPGNQDFKRRLDGMVIDGVLSSPEAVSNGAILKGGTTVKAVGGDRLQVTQPFRAHTGWSTLTDINCTIRYDLVIKAKDGSGTYVPYDQNASGQIATTEVIVEPKGGKNGDLLVTCGTTWYQDLMISFIGSWLGLFVFNAPPLPSDWTISGLSWFLTKYAATSLVWNEIKSLAWDYFNKLLSGKLVEAFSDTRNEYGAFPAGYHLCFPTLTGGYAPIMNEARDGGVSVCVE
jgi:hypothetical protein